MSKMPHLFRRGNMQYFRLSVPLRFRPVLKISEFTQSLRTQNRKDAIPAAYKLAGEAKELFNYLDSVMDKKGPDDYDESALHEILNELERAEAAGEAKISLLLARKKMAINARKDIKIEELENKIFDNNRKNKKEIELALDAKELEIYRKLHAIRQSTEIKQPPTQNRSKSPRLSVVRQSLIENIGESNPSANKKTNAEKWWSAFVELIGNKQVVDLEQIDIDCFLEEICFLPSKDNLPEHKKLTFKEKISLCKKTKSETISPKTYANSYKSPVKKFIEHGYKEFKNSGFKKLTVNDANKYYGNQVAGKGEQRPLLISEVNKLVNNDVMKAIISDREKVHFYWLLVVGLFSGARLNEICQLHPTNDIRQDKSGIWFFEVTEDGANQSAKTKASKKDVPIHQKLIDLGFIDYVLDRRLQNACVVFPFTPRKRGNIENTGDNAGQNVTTYLKKIGLFDETSGNKISGLHCLRKTFITEAATCGMVSFSGDDIDRFRSSLGRIAPIVGHESGAFNKAGENVCMTAFYAKRKLEELKKGDIAKKKAVVDFLDYGVVFPTPKQ